MPDAAEQSPSLPMSAAVLRRLAEAADGYRTGETVYFVMSVAPPHEVIGTHPDASSAAAEAARATKEYGGEQRFAVSPPCTTPPDHPRTGEVLSVSIRVRTPGGEEQITIEPRTHDALFWSLAAIDKLVIPYYALIHGVAEAARLRLRLEAQLLQRGVVVVPHKLWTQLL